MSKIKYYSLKKLINDGISPEEIDKIVMNILKVTLPIKDDYPEYKDWFLNKQVKGINTDRDIIFAVYNEEIVGVSNIKGDILEKKICTLYIKECFRKNSIGSNLIKLSCEELETDKPLITISSNKIYDYRKIIIKNQWELSEELNNFYKTNSDEYVFNGSMYIRKESPTDELIKIYKKNNNIIKIEYMIFNTKLSNIIIKLFNKLKRNELHN